LRAARAERSEVPSRQTLAVAVAVVVGVGAFGQRPSWAASGVEPTWSARLSSPQIVSASFGLLIGEIEPRQPPASGTHLPHGLLLQVEPGLGGGKASVGYVKGLLPYAAGGLKASVLRTWGHPVFADRHQTYLGVEGEAAFFINLSLGVMRRVAGPGTGRWMLTGGVGLGF
jgi:hypothetical protein